MIGHLVGDAAPAGPWNAALVAIEGREFRKAIDILWPIRDELDDRSRVQLALALDSVGRRDDAVEVLGASKEGRSDIKGTLAGRFKRSWLAEGRLVDAKQAYELYSEGLAEAEKAEDAEQAYYHAINVAFMGLAHEGDRSLARSFAERALEHVGAAPVTVWSRATAGEANLYLGRDGRALESYRKALDLGPGPGRSLPCSSRRSRWRDFSNAPTRPKGSAGSSASTTARLPSKPGGESSLPFCPRTAESSLPFCPRAARRRPSNSVSFRDSRIGGTFWAPALGPFCADTGQGNGRKGWHGPRNQGRQGRRKTCWDRRKPQNEPPQSESPQGPTARAGSEPTVRCRKGLRSSSSWSSSLRSGKSRPRACAASGTK